jgi:NADPH-dependent F420 reductase
MAAVAAANAPALTGRPVAILGGTGAQGRGLGRRLAMTGHPVVLGSRSADRAAAAAAALRSRQPGLPVTGATNADAATSAEVVVAAVPWEGHDALLAGLAGQLAGRILVDCVNPVAFDDRGAFPLRPPRGSAAEHAAAVLPDSRVVAAFHHVSAVSLLDADRETLDGDVLVLGDDRAATDLVEALAAQIPRLRGRYAGPLRLAHAVEALTANIIAINRRYRAHAGIGLTDV